MGSKKIARGLASRGVDLQERMVRNYLEQMDANLDNLAEALGEVPQG